MARLIINGHCFLFKQLTRPYLFSHQRSVHACDNFYSEHDGGPAWSSKAIMTVGELRIRFMKMRGVTPGFKLRKEDRSYLLQYLPSSQADLPPRTVKESFQEAIIPLSSDPFLEEKYISASMQGRIRFGRLMEDLDMFADWIAMNYIKNPKQPKGELPSYHMVTVLVDHMSFTDYVPLASMDIRISGIVSAVGKTTMETTVWLEQISNGQLKRITKAIFLMAARNATLSGGAFVNPLVPADKEEEEIVKEGRARMKMRKARESGPFLTMPSAEEQEIVHKLFIESMDAILDRRVLPPGCEWMTNTKRDNNIFTFTEDRNFLNTVFGGFIMRHALEMAWFTAYYYSNSRVTLRGSSNIHFRHPVTLGSVISFHGQVIYTEGNFLQIFVHGDVTDTVEKKTVTSITFNFTYESPDPIRRVKPDSYYEAMMYLAGRRHFIATKSRFR